MKLLISLAKGTYLSKNKRYQALPTFGKNYTVSVLQPFTVVMIFKKVEGHLWSSSLSHKRVQEWNTEFSRHDWYFQMVFKTWNFQHGWSEFVLKIKVDIALLLTLICREPYCSLYYVEGSSWRRERESGKWVCHAIICTTEWLLFFNP